MFPGDMDVVKGLDRLENTLIELIREQQETNRLQQQTNELLKRVGVTLAQIRDKDK